MDFYIYEDVVYISVRSLAELIGMSPGALLDPRHGLLLRIQKGQNLPPSLEQWAGFDHKQAGKIPQDLACSIIIYYAYEAGPACKDRARLVVHKLTVEGLSAFVRRN